MKRRALHRVALMALVSAALPVRAALAKESKTAASGIAFASPEDAVEHIATTLREGDLAAALAAFDIDERVANYSFVKMAQRLQAIALATTPPPVGFAFYRDVAKVQFTHEASLQLRNLTYSLLVPSGTPLDKIITFGDDEDIGQSATELEMALDPARLTNLRVLRTAVPSPEIANGEVHRRNIMSQLAVTGGEDLQERLALYELDGRTYAGGFTLVRYGDRWQVRSLVAVLGGTSSQGHAEPVSEAEFAPPMYQ